MNLWVSFVTRSINGRLLKTTKTFVVREQIKKMEKGRLQSCRFEGGWYQSMVGRFLESSIVLCMWALQAAWIWGKYVVARWSLGLGRWSVGGAWHCWVYLQLACQFSIGRSIYLFIIPADRDSPLPLPSKL